MAIFLCIVSLYGMNCLTLSYFGFFRSHRAFTLRKREGRQFESEQLEEKFKEEQRKIKEAIQNDLGEDATPPGHAHADADGRFATTLRSLAGRVRLFPRVSGRFRARSSARSTTEVTPISLGGRVRPQG